MSYPNIDHSAAFGGCILVDVFHKDLVVQSKPGSPEKCYTTRVLGHPREASGGRRDRALT